MEEKSLTPANLESEKVSQHRVLLELTQFPLEAFANKVAGIGTFADLSQASDTVDHTLLLQKLDFYGIRRILLSLTSSYLNNRLEVGEVALPLPPPFFPFRVEVPPGSWALLFMMCQRTSPLLSVSYTLITPLCY